MGKQRRILIVTATFFPDPMVASVRMTQWCRFLPESGWLPTVLCRHYGRHATPELLGEHVHEQVTVRYLNRAPSVPADVKWKKEGSRFSFKREIAARLGAWTVPDASRVFWNRVKPKVRQAVEELKPDVILTSSPPHAVHSAGLGLGLGLSGGVTGSRGQPIPWVVDYRDPHTIDARCQPEGLGRLAMPLHRRYERQVLERASLITCAIPVHARWITATYPATRGKVLAIPNGYPPEAIDPAYEPVRVGQARYSVRTVGSIAPEDALQIAHAIATLVEQGMDVNYVLVGNPPANADAITEVLGDRLQLSGYVSHDQAIRYVKGADVLISYLSPERSTWLQLTSKLFEYLAAGVPIIEVNASRPDRRMLRRVPGVTLMQTPTVREMAKAIGQAIESGRPSLASTREFVAPLARRDQTRLLARRLEALVAGEG